MNGTATGPMALMRSREYRIARLQAAAVPASFHSYHFGLESGWGDHYRDAARLLAALSNGMSMYWLDEPLPEANKGAMRVSTDWCRLFIRFVGEEEFRGWLVVRDNGLAMFARWLPGFPAKVTLDVLDPAVFNKECDGLVGEYAMRLDEMHATLLLNPWSASREPSEALVDFYETAGGSGFPRSRPSRGAEATMQAALVDPLVGSVTVNIVSREDLGEWAFQGDYAVKWAASRRHLSIVAPKYQRLLAGWDFIVKEMVRLLDVGRVPFVPGFLVDGGDVLAELAEWGGRTFMLLNPEGIRVSDPQSRTVLALRDRAAHTVAHIGRPNHDEAWARAQEFLLSESILPMGRWKRKLCSLSSYGASMTKKERGHDSG